MASKKHSVVLPLFLAAALLAGLALWAYDRAHGMTPFSRDEARSNAIQMRDQSVGKNVTVAEASLAAGGFVVIQDDEEGPGQILGASGYLKAGEAKGLRIALKNALAPGYDYAVLYRDNGDKKFDPAKDSPVKDAQGSVIAARFLVSP